MMGLKRAMQWAVCSMMLVVLCGTLTGCVGVRAGVGSVEVGAGVPLRLEGAVDPAAGTAGGAATDTVTGDRIFAVSATVNWPAALMAAKRTVMGWLPDLMTIFGAAAAEAAPVAPLPLAAPSGGAGRGGGSAVGTVR